MCEINMIMHEFTNPQLTFLLNSLLENNQGAKL